MIARKFRITLPSLILVNIEGLKLKQHASFASKKEVQTLNYWTERYDSYLDAFIVDESVIHNYED